MIDKPVRRTLIITAGPLAEAAGAHMAHLLDERQGAATAVTILTINSEDVGETKFNEQLTEALNRISPLNLGQQLAQTGWQLVQPRTLNLVLIIDAAVGAEQQAKAIGQTAVATIQWHLGLDSEVTLIWLATEIDTVAARCLQASASFSYAPRIFALSLLNEEGLRLPDERALSTVCAEFVWCLSLTPFYHFLAERFADADEAVSDQTTVTSVGMRSWHWSATAVYQKFRQRWQWEAVTHWLAAEPSSQTPETWLQQHRLDRESLTTTFLEKQFVPIPAYTQTARYIPWPWEMAGYFTHLQALEQADIENTAVFGQHARQKKTSLQEQAGLEMGHYLTHLLDTQPYAGLDAAAQWSLMLGAGFVALHEQLLDEAAVYDGIDSELTDERTQVEAHISQQLEEWPGGQWHHWLKLSWQLWRWPQLAWRYWQLRQLGQRLAGLLAQQATRRRQKALHDILTQMVSELEQLTQQWHARVEEVAMMLSNFLEDLQHSFAPENMPPASLPMNNNGHQPLGIPPIEIVTEEEGNVEVLLMAPDGLYERLLPDAQQEAAVAATAVGGLGRQLQRLDETVLLNLAQVAGERLAGVWTLTAVDILDSLHNTPQTWAQWWQTAWQAAAPLWQYDEGQLSEGARQNSWRTACIMGAGARRLPALLSQAHDRLSDAAERPPHTIRNADHNHLVMIRIRHGATIKREEVHHEQ